VVDTAVQDSFTIRGDELMTQTHTRTRTAALVTIDGIDGAGKATQTEAVADSLRSKGYTVATLDFPQYRQNRMGHKIKEMLEGRLGDAAAMPALAAACLFSLDRRESLPRIRNLSACHDVMILDRWVMTNVVYQAAREQLERQLHMLCMETVELVEFIEYDMLELPKASVAYFLDISPTETARLMADAGRDLDEYEKNEDLQWALYHGFKAQAQRADPSVIKPVSVPCTPLAGGHIKPPEEITQWIVSNLETTALAHVTPSGTPRDALQ
jgi:dTMP kinase